VTESGVIEIGTLKHVQLLNSTDCT